MNTFRIIIQAADDESLERGRNCVKLIADTVVYEQAEAFEIKARETTNVPETLNSRQTDKLKFRIEQIKSSK